MAFHQVRKDGVIVARWKKADGTWGTKSRNPDTGRRFKDGDEADTWGEEMEVLERRGLVPRSEPEPADDGLTVNEWFAEWWPGVDLGLRSRGNYEYLFRAHILPEWGHWKLKDITANVVNAWEQRMIRAGYSRDGVATAARSKFGTLLGDAVVNGHLNGNPALRQRNRGRRSGVGTGGRGPEKVWITSSQVVPFAERLAVLSGRDDDFILAVLFAFAGLRWGEAMGLQPGLVKLGKIRIDWQLVEVGGKFFLLPPKDDSNRGIDTPPFLAGLLSRQAQARAGQRCACTKETIEGQPEQPCAGGAFMFLGPRQGHLRNSNYIRRYFDPAADGGYGGDSGLKRRRPPRPVLVNLGEGTVWPGEVWPMYDAVIAGRGTKIYDPDDDRFAIAEWAPIARGLSPHGLRYSHATMLADLGVDEKLRDERMGHLSKGKVKSNMRLLYSQISDTARERLNAGLQEVWERALAERAWFSLRSPVKVLDELLAPFRDGRREPVAPFESHGEVLQFPTARVG